MALIAASAHSHPMSESTIKSCFGPLYTCLGLYEGDELYGFAILHQIFEDATLMDICVAPSHQGRGFGKALLDRVIEQARANDAEVLLLEVRESAVGARALYVKVGFEQSGIRKGYYKTNAGPEDAILMTLTF
ncbi:ribosomal protein S18-alanine N-acetyltransferase [Shewanella gelidimarina]|uniref:ribosomal protein S18-alanine N-acetyltransferase n=1 Tax=Shewanella gelidimarina TaxID=56813 RepID=UPI00200E5F01|nr:ribosomal protein S18-alanine N-acetyltransferase [Shewanella gelidimarina]MCL1058228.1 ribosomal protein S18-alanine N-acetyltransferase [Shewanella gelidimarina]